MPVRFIAREELLDLEKISSVAFVYSLDVNKRAEQLRSKGDPEEKRIAYANDEGKMTAGMALPEYDMWFDGTVVKMVGIGGVVSLPEHRHERAIRKCFDFAFRDMLKNGVAFSALYPFSHPFYRKFGYELCLPTFEYTVRTKDLSKLYRHEGWAKMYEKPAPLMEYRRIFETCYSRYNCAILRDEAAWLHSRLRADPYRDRVYAYLLGDENGTNAYVICAAEDAPPHDHVLNVLEIAYLTPPALRSALGFIGRLAAQYSTARLSLPPDVPIHHLIDESYDVTTRVKNQVMFRVVNAELALSAMIHPVGATYTISIRDDGIPENDGTFLVRAGEGGAQVERTACEDCDLSLDIRTLAPLVLGGLSLEQAAFRPDVKLSGNHETLKSVFVKRPYHLTEGF